ncbi:unnamed protein product [Caenorhabditis nigoni]
MPFPILRTPFVVLSEIISLLEPNELVTASFYSKNLACLLKGYFRQRKPSQWKLFMLDYDFIGYVRIVDSKEKATTAMMAKHISQLVGAAHKPNEPESPVMYFEDRVWGTKLIVDYVSDLFNLDVYGLYIDINGFWTIDWVNNRQEKMLEGIALAKNSKNDCYGDQIMCLLSDYVLRNGRFSDWLFIEDNFSDNIRFNGKLGPAGSLLISPSSHWVTIDNLMNFDFINMGIRGSRLSYSDLNKFLRHWRAGGSPRLACLQVKFEMDTEFEDFDEGLEVVETNEVRKYRVEAEWEDSDYEVQGGYSIQRMDGVKATINCDLREFLMVVWHTDRN